MLVPPPRNSCEKRQMRTASTTIINYRTSNKPEPHRQNYQHLYYKTGVYLFSFLIPFDISPRFCLLIKGKESDGGMDEFQFDFDEKFTLPIPRDDPSSPGRDERCIGICLDQPRWPGHFYNTISYEEKRARVYMYVRRNG